MPFPAITNIGSINGFYDDFNGAAINPAIAGTSENSGTAAIVVAQRGGVGGLVTGTSSGNRSAFTTGLNYRASDGSIIVQWRAKPVTSVANVAYFYGLTDTVSLEMPIEISTATITGNADDAVGIYFDTAATTPAWRFSGVNTTAVTGTVSDIVTVNNVSATPTADVYEVFRIEVSPAGDATFSYGKENGNEEIQGWQEVGTIYGAVAAGVNLTPVAIVETRTTAAKTAYVDALFIDGGREGTF